MSLDLSSLEKSILALERSLKDFQLAENSGQTHFKSTIQAGIVQCFEVSFELSWKFMKRWLELNVSPDALVGVTKKELFRYAHDQASHFLVEAKFLLAALQSKNQF